MSLAQPSRRTAPRGSVSGPVVFALVLASVTAGGFLWLQGRNERLDAAGDRAAGSGQTADKWTGRLGKFLRTGPTSGTWETRSLSCVYTNYIAPHPTMPEAFLVAQVDASGVHRPRVVSRWLIPRHFFRAPAHLFFTNYVRTEGPMREELEDGPRTWRVHWGPRVPTDSLTERIVWFTEIGGEVVQIEDRSRSGRLIRRVRRLSTTTGTWKPQDVDSRELEHYVSEPPAPNADPEEGLRACAHQAPFRVYQPEYLPPGFVLVRSSYSVCDASLSPGEEEGPLAGGREPGAAPAPPAAPVQLVSQLYSDGLALISVGIAPRDDMNVIEQLTAGMTETDDPAACPGLPADPRDLLQNGSVVRMRTDSCRIVLRRDDLEGVSVTIIGRNELPTEEYLRMVGSLVPLGAASD